MNSCQDLAWHREEDNPPVVVTLLRVTLSLPDRNDNAPSPVGQDDPALPNGAQHSVQPQHLIRILLPKKEMRRADGARRVSKETARDSERLLKER